MIADRGLRIAESVRVESVTLACVKAGRNGVAALLPTPQPPIRNRKGGH